MKTLSLTLRYYFSIYNTSINEPWGQDPWSSQGTCPHGSHRLTKEKWWITLDIIEYRKNRLIWLFVKSNHEKGSPV